MIPTPETIPRWVQRINVCFAEPDEVPTIFRKYPCLQDSYDVFVDSRDNIQTADWSFLAWRTVFVHYAIYDARRMRFLAHAIDALEIKPQRMIVSCPEGIYVRDYQKKTGKMYAI